MRCIAVILVAASACYSPSYRDCDVTCVGGACPSGFVCEHEVCRVEGFSGACGAAGNDSGVDVDGAAGVDTDGDGINDDRDNCITVANTSQANEDLDARGDACDPCPISALPGADADSDGDGVGDGCDPEVSFANKIVLFEGFSSATLPANSLANPASAWTFSNGQAKVGSIPNASLTWPETLTASDYVATHFIIEAIGTNFSAVGVIDQFDGASLGSACWLGKTTTMVGLHLSLPNGQNDKTAQGPYAPNQLAQVSSLHGGNIVTCRENVAQLQIAGGTPGAASPPRVGLISTTTTASFDWVMVISRGP